MVKNKVGLVALSSVLCMLSFGSAFAGVKNVEMYNSREGLYSIECTSGKKEHSIHREGSVWHQGAFRMSDRYDNQSIDSVARGICG